MKSLAPSRYCRTARSRALLAAAVLRRQKFGPFLSLQKGYQVVLHLLLGFEDGVLIGDQQLLEPGILQPDIVRDPAVIEDIPLKRGTGLGGAALPLKHVAQLRTSRHRSRESQRFRSGRKRDRGLLWPHRSGRIGPQPGSSALRISGRRRRRSAGMPTTTSGGETGISEAPVRKSARYLPAAGPARR